MTPRQAEIATLIGEGLSNHEIAERLGISHGTVKSQIYQACKAHGAHGRREIVGKQVRENRSKQAIVMDNLFLMSEKQRRETLWKIQGRWGIVGRRGVRAG